MPRNFENLGEVDKYLEKYNLPKLNEQEAKYTFFSNAHGTFSKIYHLTGQASTISRILKSCQAFSLTTRD